MPTPAGGVRTVDILSNLTPKATTYASNLLKTTKYTKYSFVSLNLMEQMKKSSNLYFTLLAMLMQAGENGVFVGTIKASSTLGTLSMMMLFSAAMALSNDLERGRHDLHMNKSQTLRRSIKRKSITYAKITFDRVKVGDILKIENEDEIPADVVCLSAANGKCFVSTANLDGETNLKPKVASLDSKHKSTEDFGFEGIKVEAEAPSKSIYTFNGSITQNGKTTAISPDNLLLRGCKLKNTDWCLGLVIYTGPDTRVQMNNVGAPPKLPNIEVLINMSMWVALILQAALALITDLWFLFERDKFRDFTYLYPDGYKSTLWLPDPVAYLFTFFVQYSNLIPISLYATIDMCNQAYATFINNDPEMNNCPQDQGLEPKARSAVLCHELGQVSFIFSDKTGTLTQNIMTLRNVCIDNKHYIRESPIPQLMKQGTVEYEFFECLALCHTCMLRPAGKYAGESPDEEAIVGYAKSKGWEFVDVQELQNGGARIQVRVGGEIQLYKLWATNKFHPDRKRMSVVVQDPKGSYVLLAKGADTSMLGDLSDADRKTHEKTILEYSRQGLRSLVIARTVLEENTFKMWYKTYSKAQTSVVNRDKLVNEAAMQLEMMDRRKMKILGLTFIEDKLQEGVGEAIHSFRDAHIKFWVLTGDNLEAAKAIGFSTQVLDHEMIILEIDSLKEFEEKTKQIDWSKSKDIAMLVTGRALTEMGNAESILTTAFIRVAERCAVLIACRVAPLQKAEMVKLVRDHVKVESPTRTPVTLAVGDGANDVPMIRAAQVGVGIYGKEGRQAAVAADFSISQFRHLRRLIFLHGRWNYRRTAKVVLFSFWRNAVQVFLMATYGILSGFSGTPLFEDTIRITFNAFCTAPIIGPGVFDRDVSEEQALTTPSSYGVGRKGEDLNPKAMAIMLSHAGMMSLIITVVFFAAQEGLSLNLIGDYWSVSCVFYTVLLVNVSVRAAFLTNTWNLYCFSLHLMFFGMYGCFLIVYNEMALKTKSAWMYHVPQHVFCQPMFWSCIAVSLVLQLGSDNIISLLESTLPGSSNKSYASSLAGDNWASFAALKQQGLRSYQIVSHRRKVYAFVICAAVPLIALGKLFQYSSDIVLDSVIGVEYHSESNPMSDEWFLVKQACPLGKSCQYELVVHQDMAPPILISYRIDPFWQNFNDYVGNATLGELSFFNDTFDIKHHRIVESDIAWESDARILQKDGILDASQRLLSWIRPGAVASLWKRYGWLKETLHEGDRLTIVVNSNYNSDAFGASKAVILTTTPLLYGPGFARFLPFLGLLFGLIGFCGMIFDSGPKVCSCRSQRSRESGDSYHKALLPK